MIPGRPPAPYRMPAERAKDAVPAPRCETGVTIYSIKKSAEGDTRVVMLELSGTMLRYP